MKKDKRTLSLLCMLAALLIFAAGMLRTAFFPADEVPYENRPANKIGSIGEYLDGGFQSSMEKALTDQVHMATKAKKLYNILNTSAAMPGIRAAQERGGYVKYGSHYFYKDILTVMPTKLEEVRDLLGAAAARQNMRAELMPGVEFYLYYVDTDLDIDLVSGEKGGCFEYLSSLLKLPEGHVGRFEINSFEQYHENFLKTDHHWNGIGSHRALLDICKMLGVEPVGDSGICTDKGRYLGTRAAGIEGLAPEDFPVTVYDFPPMHISVKGQELADYGRQAELIAGELEHVSYGSVFGGDSGELLFETDREGETLLVMGDSYDNALIKALAGSFSKTYVVDLRAYETDVGLPFDIYTYVQEHGIDKVLSIGSVIYYTAGNS